MMRLAASVTVMVTLLACLLFSGAGAADLTMLSPYSRNFIIDQEVTQRYLAIVQSLGTGEELSIRLFGPDVVPPFHQLEPVQAGLFDLVLSPPSYHAGNLPAAMALGGLSGNAAAWRAAGIWQAIDEMYRRRGLKLLALPQMGSRSAQIALREPIGPEGLHGRKIRGTLTYQPLIRRLEGIPVSLPSHEIYAALERGVIDGAALGVIGAEHIKIQEVTGFLLRPAFGVVTTVIAMNLTSWSAASAEHRQQLLRAGRMLEDEIPSRIDELAQGEQTLLLDSGMVLTHAGDEMAGSFDVWYARGMWQFALQHGGAEARELYERAAQAGLLVDSPDPLSGLAHE